MKFISFNFLLVLLHGLGNKHRKPQANILAIHCLFSTVSLPEKYIETNKGHNSFLHNKHQIPISISHTIHSFMFQMITGIVYM